MIIESSVIGPELIFEHHNYLPSQFLILMAVMPVDRVIRSPGAKASLLAVVPSDEEVLRNLAKARKWMKK